MSLNRRQFIVATASVAILATTTGTPQAAIVWREPALPQSKAEAVEALRRVHVLRRQSYSAGNLEVCRQCDLFTLKAIDWLGRAGITGRAARNVYHAGYVMSERDAGRPWPPAFWNAWKQEAAA